MPHQENSWNILCHFSRNLVNQSSSTASPINSIKSEHQANTARIEPRPRSSRHAPPCHRGSRGSPSRAIGERSGSEVGQVALRGQFHRLSHTHIPSHSHTAGRGGAGTSHRLRYRLATGKDTRYVGFLLRQKKKDLLLFSSSSVVHVLSIISSAQQGTIWKLEETWAKAHARSKSWPFPKQNLAESLSRRTWNRFGFGIELRSEKMGDLRFTTALVWETPASPWLQQANVPTPRLFPGCAEMDGRLS